MASRMMFEHLSEELDDLCGGNPFFVQAKGKRPVNPVLDTFGSLRVVLITDLWETRHGCAS